MNLCIKLVKTIIILGCTVKKVPPPKKKSYIVSALSRLINMYTRTKTNICWSLVISITNNFQPAVQFVYHCPVTSANFGSFIYHIVH